MRWARADCSAVIKGPHVSRVFLVPCIAALSFQPDIGDVVYVFLSSLVICKLLECYVTDRNNSADINYTKHVPFDNL